MNNGDFGFSGLALSAVLFFSAGCGGLFAAGKQAQGGFAGVTSEMLSVCLGIRSCFSALDGKDRELCEVYKEDSSCMFLDGADRGWCQVIKEGKSCFLALDGEDRDNCDKHIIPDDHYFWSGCSNSPAQYSSEVMEACEGTRSCFTLQGKDRGFCEAYKEGTSCFMALEGKDRGWCEIVKENSTCHFSLDAEDQDACNQGWTPREQRFWKACGGGSPKKAKSKP